MAKMYVPDLALGDVLRSAWWLDRMYLALEVRIQKTIKTEMMVFIVQESGDE